jgi:predicted RNA-binding Zn ribbon-like protein
MERLEGYENVGHVIGVLEEFHRQLVHAFSKWREQTDDERSKLIVGYLADHQARRAQALEDFHRDAPRSLLTSWFQIPFPEDPRAFLRSVQSAEAPAPGQIEEVISRIDDFLDRMLHHMRDRAETHDVEAFFNDLLEIEKRERMLRSRAMSSFHQI